jgi:hypothetical protein
MAAGATLRWCASGYTNPHPGRGSTPSTSSISELSAIELGQIFIDRFCGAERTVSLVARCSPHWLRVFASSAWNWIPVDQGLMVSNSISQDVNFPDLLMHPVTGQLFAFFTVGCETLWRILEPDGRAGRNRETPQVRLACCPTASSPLNRSAVQMTAPAGFAKSVKILTVRPRCASVASRRRGMLAHW